MEIRIMNSFTVKEVQQALHAKGFSPGEIDGIWGRKTTAAVKRFQENQGLEADGIIGPKTGAKLFGATLPDAKAPVLPWLEEARNLVGTKEVLGEKRHNPVILDWAKNLDISYKGDEVPWCGLFVAHCVGATLPSEVLPGNPLGARQWRKFGDPVEPRLGSVLVFWRESPNGSLGHVGFYTGEDATAYRILGGNQENKVCIMWIAKDRLLASRWPAAAASLAGTATAVAMQRDAELATNLA
ncbi:MAG TPA: TIGR02594 family protein [Bordetella sp.]|nr:TIGR02594 family protein [Bordetella sp.]